MEEAKLIEAARKDPDAFGILFDKYYKPILNYTLRRVADVAVAQDLTSETFVKAYTKLWQFRFRGVGFSAWLYRIATNEIRMYYRGKRPLSLDQLMESTGFDLRDELNLTEELMNAETHVERHQEFLKVQRVLQTLPLHYQEVIALRFFEEKSLKEIAEILGKREGTVKSLLSRGLEKLRVVQPS